MISARSVEWLYAAAKAGSVEAFEVLEEVHRHHGTAYTIAQCGQPVCWDSSVGDWIDYMKSKGWPKPGELTRAGWGDAMPERLVEVLDELRPVAGTDR